jgi:predicted MPP superfamily phosphohydrolase
MAAFPLRRILAFLTVVALVTGVAHAYVGLRLIGTTALPAPYGTLALTALAGGWGLLLTGMIAGRTAPRSIGSPVAWIAYLWLGLFGYLLTFTLLAELPRLLLPVGAWALNLDLAPDLEVARARAFAIGIVGAASLLTVFGLVNVLRGPRVTRVQIPLERLPAGTPPFTLVQLTDVHVGPTIGRAFIERVVATVNALQPDVVVITGDLVDGPVATLAPHVEPLRGLVSRHGTFFITGNHEYISGARSWLEFLPTLGLKALRNARVSLGPIELAGVDDHDAHRFGAEPGEDIAQALTGRDSTRPVVLLAHQPRAIHGAARHQVDLQLSGHTHGGQMWPWNHVVPLQQPYVAGLHRHASTLIYVSRGTGYWGPPLRVGAPAEITLVELVPTLNPGR